MIDTHTHLNSSRFKKNRGEIIRSAQAAGVEAMIIPGTDLKDSRLAVELTTNYEGIYAAVGIHPHDATVEHDWDELESLLTQPMVVAVGETGLDAHYTGSVPQLQIVSFRKHVQLAIKYHKPLIIHSRQATDELIQMFEGIWDDALKGNAVLHCCEPDPRLFEFARQHNWYIGIDGDVTYDADKIEFIQTAPLEMLLLETDAPYLLPEPLRSQKKYPNEPANLSLIAQKVADIKEVAVEEVDQMTSQNARTLFNLPKPQL